MSTSFIQFQYCPLCRISHKQRKKKHIYSSRHQTILKNVLAKFSKKVSNGRSAMSPPLVQPPGWKVDAEFWCYFCQKEVKKHRQLDDCTLAYGGLIEHTSSKEHAKKMADFFWHNIIHVGRKQEFVIKNEDYNRYLVQSVTAVADFQTKVKERIAQEAENILEAERRNQFVRWMGMREQHVKQTYGSAVGRDRPPLKTSHGSSFDEAGELVKGRRTVAAYGEGLTCIIRPQDEEEGNDTEGNIFTGATPPWLREEPDKGQSQIGPTIEDLTKHLEREKKRKLPACRVGAKFNHKEDTSAEWLPSFGRVWNHGRRLNSQQQFMREKRAPSATITSADIVTAAESSDPSPRPSTLGYRPYQRKRPASLGVGFPSVAESSLSAPNQIFSGLDPSGQNWNESQNGELAAGGNGMYVNPLAHAATGTVNSTGGCMHKGVTTGQAYHTEQSDKSQHISSLQSHQSNKVGDLCSGSQLSISAGAHAFSYQSYTGPPSSHDFHSVALNTVSSKLFAGHSQEAFYLSQPPVDVTLQGSAKAIDNFVPLSVNTESLYVMPYQKRRRVQTSSNGAFDPVGGLISTKLLSTPVLLKSRTLRNSFSS